MAKNIALEQPNAKWGKLTQKPLKPTKRSKLSNITIGKTEIKFFRLNKNLDPNRVFSAEFLSLLPVLVLTRLANY